MKRSVGTGNRGNMRPGLISLLTVVVVISLATAAVLTITTSHAMHALSSRQAQMTTEGYEAERSAQTFVALLDDELAAARANGNTGTNGLMARIEDDVNAMLAQACANGITATYEVEDATITCTFLTPNGRMLQTSITVDDGASYSIDSWKLTAAPQEEDTGDTLWTGPTAGE